MTAFNLVPGMGAWSTSWGRVTVSITATVASAVVLAPTATADPTADLKAGMDAARSETGCPPLVLDPILTAVSQRVAGEMSDYVAHTATSLPTTGDNDLLPTGAGGVLPVMRQAGYNTNNARLILGYGDHRMGGSGDNQAKAVRATVLQAQGFEAISNCEYSRYGLTLINHDDISQGSPSTAPRTFSATAVILAGPAY